MQYVSNIYKYYVAVQAGQELPERPKIDKNFFWKNRSRSPRMLQTCSSSPVGPPHRSNRKRIFADARPMAAFERREQHRSPELPAVLL